MGMVFDVLVAGQDVAGDTGGYDAGHVLGGFVTADQGILLISHVDSALGPFSEQRVHQLTFEVEELPLEVAPGFWQQRWTFNGSPVGPTLHGRVGDVFEITLVNNGTMGYSIDFHAGELAFDELLCIILPGELLVYMFTANRAGIWMYYCSTVPMSVHIVVGMHGVVIIELDGLFEVDRSYVVVQFEVYLSGAVVDAGAATEVAIDRVVTG